MMDVVGYAIIKKDAKSGVSTIDLEKFKGERVRVLEFSKDGGVLVIDRDACALATFDKDDVKSSFECKIYGEYICPPELDYLGQMAYATKCLTRKGGYDKWVREMVVASSLHKGKFNDGFLWQKQ